MDLHSPSSSPEMQRKTRFDLPPPRPQTFEQACGSGRTFLDEASFEYKALTIQYFDREAAPTRDAGQFLDVLQAVLTATEQDFLQEEDGVKETVRAKFIELYREDSEELQRTPHAVHEMVHKMSATEVEFVHWGSFVPTFDRVDPMQAEIDKYFEMQSSAVDKYLDESSPADPCDHPEEFYGLYTAILRNCLKAPALSASMSRSMVSVADPRSTLRSKFDRIYEANQQGLRKCWAEDHSRWASEIEQLQTTPFVPSFRSPPTMQSRSGGGLFLPPPKTHGVDGGYSFSTSPAAFSMGSSTLPPPRESFETLQSTLGPFDFEGHGLQDFSERIGAFYNAAPNINLLQGTLGYSSGSSHQAPTTRFPLGEEDLFAVLKAVLTQLKPAQTTFLEEDTVDSVVRSRFIEIFHFAAAADSESQGGLTKRQIDEINSLVGHSEKVCSRPLHPPQPWVGSDPRSDRPSFGRKPPSGGGNGGNPIVKGALLILALYLGYRYVAQPAYQWMRGNKTTPVGE